MKILYVIGQLGRGGAEQQFYYLLKYLRPEACVVSLRPDGYWADPIRELGIEVIELKRRGRADLSRLFELIRIIRRYKPDIIHVFIDTAYALYGRLAAILSGHPRVIVGERAHPTYTPRWYILLRRFVLNRAVRLIAANSEAAVSYLIAGMALPRQKAVFIPNGIEIERLETEANLGPAELPEEWKRATLVGCVADLSPRKNPDLFLQVARQVTTKYGHVKFVWVGGGLLSEHVEQERRAFDLESSVLFAGHQKEIPRWLKAMDIFLLTSTFEGMPNAVMEAMVMGLPCVVTDAGGSRELVRDGVTGFVVPVGDDAALCRQLSRLIDDTELRQTMGNAGRTAIQAYDVQRMADAYGRVYENMMSDRTGAP